MENLKSIIEKRKKVLEGELGGLTKRLSEAGIIIEDYTEGEGNIIWLDLELPNGWVTVLKVNREDIAYSVYDEAINLDVIETAMVYYNDDISFRKKSLKNILRELTNYKNILIHIAIELLDDEGYFDEYLLNEELKLKIIRELDDFFYMEKGVFVGELDYARSDVDDVYNRLVKFYDENILELKKDKDKEEINKRIIKDLENVLNNNI